MRPRSSDIRADCDGSSVSDAFDSPPRGLSWQALALLSFTGFMLVLVSLKSLEGADAYVATLSDAFRRMVPPNRLAVRLSRLSAQLAAGWVGFGVAVARRRGRPWGEIAWHLFVLGVGLLLFQGFRSVLDRYRPGGPLIHPIPNSFPSGHVANAVLCVVTVAHLVAPRRGTLDKPLRAIAFVVGTLFVGAVAFTRIYFALHWFSDVVASLLFGMVFIAVCRARRERITDALAFVLLALVLYAAAACDVRVSLPSPPPGHRRTDLVPRSARPSEPRAEPARRYRDHDQCSDAQAWFANRCRNASKHA